VSITNELEFERRKGRLIENKRIYKELFDLRLSYWRAGRMDLVNVLELALAIVADKGEDNA
jgi:hypothetical protein